MNHTSKVLLVTLGLLMLNLHNQLPASEKWQIDTIITTTLFGGCASWIIGSLIYQACFKPSDKAIVGRCIRVCKDIKKKSRQTKRYYSNNIKPFDNKLKKSIKKNRATYPFLSYKNKVLNTIETLKGYIAKLQAEKNELTKRKVTLKKDDDNYQVLFGTYTKAAQLADKVESEIRTIIDLLIQHHNRIMAFPEYDKDCYRAEIARLRIQKQMYQLDGFSFHFANVIRNW